jgi:signal transduction histidine kinase
MKNISLSEKLILYFLCLGLGTIFLISTYTYFSTQQALMSRTFDQLTSLRVAKKNQVEIFFRDRVKDVTLLAGSDETKFIASALDKSNEGNNRKEFSEFLNKYKSLTSYFTRVMIIGNNADFISGNTYDPRIVSGKMKGYDTRGYPDSTGGVVIRDEVPDAVTGKVKMLLEAPVLNQDQDRTGWIVLEMTPDAINRIMLNKDPRSGLGLTGETYLVGADFRMRSDSRFIRNSIFQTRVRTQPVMNAIQGQEGQLSTLDYRSIPVLSSYSRLSIPGLKWIILAEIDLKEAMIPITRMRNSIILLGTLISIVFFFFVFVISKRITRPINQLKEAVLKVGRGQYDINIPVLSNDEIGALTEAFNSMSQQIKEKTIELQTERIGRIRSVIDAEEKERQRLSREIHDGIGQALIAQKLQMESLLYMDDDTIKEQIVVQKDQFNHTIDEIRRISNNLMPSVLEVFGITIALRNLCKETEEHTGIRIGFECEAQLDNLTTKTSTYLYRIAQEALNNIIKHSEAKQVWVILSRSGDTVTFIIRDDGKGFDMKDAFVEGGNGLQNMRNRVALMEGTITVESSPDKGTTLQIIIPAE